MKSTSQNQNSRQNLSQNQWRAILVLILALPLLACRQPPAPSPDLAVAAATITLQSSQVALVAATDCAGKFITHNLDFATGTRLREIRTYESNGAGVAVNDLDNDGDLDLVFASIDRQSTILWNQGELRFAPQPLEARMTSAVSIVDADGDGYLDIAFTHRGLEPISFWRNFGTFVDGANFERSTLLGVEPYANALAWADLNQDGALDLITGSYNTVLKQFGMDAPEADDKAGIFVYEQYNGEFLAQRLSGEAETLSIGVLDLDGDRLLDLWLANDFLVHDQVWTRKNGFWQQSKPFAQTSYSTMSLEWGDIANNGELALFATDMNPYDISPATLAAWLPVLNALAQPHAPSDVQRMSNTLQVRTAAGRWRNEAGERGVEATGWSWAGKFGDLDRDGLLDLYVVNGMIAANLFAHLPFGELIEENQALRNQGNGVFVPAPQWDLAATTSGRGMVMADLDGDGDLDIVVNNLRKQAQLFENQLCGGAALEVDLRWPGSGNSHAIGAQVTLRTDQGTMLRDVRAAGGYLSGDPTRLHFGFPESARLLDLTVVWPDGEVGRIEEPVANKLVTIIR